MALCKMNTILSNYLELYIELLGRALTEQEKESLSSRLYSYYGYDKNNKKCIASFRPIQFPELLEETIKVIYHDHINLYRYQGFTQNTIKLCSIIKIDRK